MNLVYYADEPLRTRQRQRDLKTHGARPDQSNHFETVTASRANGASRASRARRDAETPSSADALLTGAQQSRAEQVE